VWVAVGSLVEVAVAVAVGSAVCVAVGSAIVAVGVAGGLRVFVAGTSVGVGRAATDSASSGSGAGVDEHATRRSKSGQINQYLIVLFINIFRFDKRYSLCKKNKQSLDLQTESQTACSRNVGYMQK
jgi:dipeptide/tripeptide permease